MTGKGEYAESTCAHCGSRRIREVNYETGRFVAGFPSACPHKDKCELEIMSGYSGISRDDGTVIKP